MKNTKKNHRKDKQLKKVQSCLLLFNVVCAGLLVAVILLYLCDFFYLDIDGDIQNRISGFELSFILAGNLNDSGNILSLLYEQNSDKIVFAAVSSCMTLFLLIGFVALFVYKAVKRMPLLSKSTLLAVAALFVALIIQLIGCSVLAGFVEQYYYASCATCIAQTLSYLPFIIFIVFVIVYFALSNWLYKKLGVAFTAK